MKSIHIFAILFVAIISFAASCRKQPAYPANVNFYKGPQIESCQSSTAQLPVVSETNPRIDLGLVEPDASKVSLLGDIIELNDEGIYDGCHSICGNETFHAELTDDELFFSYEIIDENGQCAVSFSGGLYYPF